MNYNEAFDYYRKLQKENIYCKAIGARVFFTRKGWEHLLNGGRDRRKPQDVKLRLGLLKLARYLIVNATTFATNSKNNTSYITLEKILKINKKKGKIRVVIKKDNKMGYIFFSVMKA
jgi:hypothetical protein